MLAFALLLSVPLSAPAPMLPCVDYNGVKYVQPPNLQGLDVWNSGPWMLADDFICTNSGPIIGIQIWGSWLNDSVDVNSLTFSLGIYDNVPADANNPFSHPGTNLLWQQTFAPGQYLESFFTSGAETFLDPGPPATMGSDSQAWYYCFYPTNPFVQTGFSTAPKTYWLAVYAQLPIPASSYRYGWKTTFTVQNDISVHAPWPGSLPTSNPGWIPTQSPTGGPLDLAFTLTTPPPPQVVCVESDFDKYVQGPNINGGYDVWNTPYVLADDFVCTNSGPISDIHLWGSWLSNNYLTNTITFWLGIYDDVPAIAGPVPAPSHPGTNLLWQQWFAPGKYAETNWTANASEQFLDPGPTNILGGDSEVWYYCFYPTNAFQQLGTPTNSKTYWLAAYAQLPAGIPQLYGWKTTTNVLNDTSVHAFWSGTPPTANPGWTPTVYQPPAGGPVKPLDLAFKLTMCGPVTIYRLAPTNVVVTWRGGGYLQSSIIVDRGYTDVPGFPTSPYTDYSVTPTNKFYRLRCY